MVPRTWSHLYRLPPMYEATTSKHARKASVRFFRTASNCRAASRPRPVTEAASFYRPAPRRKITSQIALSLASSAPRHRPVAPSPRWPFYDEHEPGPRLSGVFSVFALLRHLDLRGPCSHRYLTGRVPTELVSSHILQLRRNRIDSSSRSLSFASSLLFRVRRSSRVDLALLEGLPRLRMCLSSIFSPPRLFL